MTPVKGRFNGAVVVLDEPPPVDHEVDVVVQFPDAELSPTSEPEANLRWYWDNAKAVVERFTSAADGERLRQRGLTPSGLPLDMPSDEEWQERATRLSQMLRQWQQEEPSDDLATREELRDGLKKHPLRFREFKLNE